MTKQEQEELGQRASRAFERELPRLWEERPGQWVAYRGSSAWASRRSNTSSISAVSSRG